MNPHTEMKHALSYLVILFLALTQGVVAQNTAPQTFKDSFNYGKTVAVFGGSVSVIPTSD